MPKSKNNAGQFALGLCAAISAAFRFDSTLRSTPTHGLSTLWILAAFCTAASCTAAFAGNREVVETSKNIASHIDFIYPQASDAARNYNFQHYVLQICRPLVLASSVFILLQSGWLAKLSIRLERIASYALRVLAYLSILTLILYLVDLPFAFYSQFILEHHFGLSNQTLSAWCLDESKRLLLRLSFVPLFLPVALIIRHRQRFWSFWIWLLIVGATMVLVYLKPIILDTMFNKFSPLPPGSLRTKIELLCAKAELRNPEIEVVDRSKQTKKINAYVTGLSNSTRIVLYDTLTRDIKEAEVLCVVAHEMAHYKYQHVLTGLALSLLAILPVLVFAEFLTNRFLPSLPRRWGIKTKADPSFLALGLGIMYASSILISPIECTIARHVETEADDFALRITGDGRSVAQLFASLARLDLIDPDPPAIIEFWLYTHPSIRHRIERALATVKTEPTAR